MDCFASLAMTWESVPALLTMRDSSYFPCASRILAWIFAMPEIQRS
jgi:hypothetical protein